MDVKGLPILHRIQSPGAYVLSNTRKRDHIFPVLASPHWLPVLYRAQCKIILLTYKAHNGLKSSYISDLLELFLECSYHDSLLWNHLPVSIQDAETLSTFKSRLKTCLLEYSYSSSLTLTLDQLNMAVVEYQHQSLPGACVNRAWVLGPRSECGSAYPNTFFLFSGLSFLPSLLLFFPSSSSPSFPPISLFSCLPSLLHSLSLSLIIMIP